MSDDRRPARWTLIIGENGVGKTTLLQCLTRMRPVFNDPSDDPNDPGPPSEEIEPELASEANNRVLEAIARSGVDGEVRLEAHLSVGLPLSVKEPGKPANMETWLTISRQEGEITRVDHGGSPSSQPVEEPLVLAYGAGRHPRDATADRGGAPDPVGSLFKAASELHDAEELLCQLDYSSLREQPGARALLDSLKKMISVMLPDVQGPQDIRVHGPPTLGHLFDKTGVYVRTPSGEVSFSQLGLGYQTVAAWTLDIAWRLIEHHRESPDPLTEPAIVIVDEIDLHLHPLWQRTIREDLTFLFPNVQFIGTAHSPLIAQNSLGENLAVVRLFGDHAVIENDPVAIRDWRLDQVLTSDLFGFESARSPDVEKLQKRRLELVTKGELSDNERDELAELERKAMELPTAETPEDQKAMDIIRQAAQLLEPKSSSS